MKVALIGNPNCGKSTLFNVLTGLNQSTANFPGATVDKKTGFAKIQNTTVEFIDLPGAYSLSTKSMDEKIATELLGDKNNPDHPDLTLFIADASDRKSTRLNSSHIQKSRMPSSA